MGNTAPAVRIPLQFELNQIQGQLETLKKNLKDTVKVDTSSYKTLSGILAKAEKYFLQISAASQEAFSSPAEIEKFQKSFQSLLTEVNMFSTKFESLSFKELKIGDSDEIKEKIKEIGQLKAEIDSIKKNKIGNLFDGDEAKNIKDVAAEFKINFGKEIKTTDFKKAFDKIEEEVKQEIKDLEATLNGTAETIDFEGTFDDITKKLENEFIPEELISDTAFNDFKEDLKNSLLETFEGLDFNGAVGKVFANSKVKITHTFIHDIIEAIKQDKEAVEKEYAEVAEKVEQAREKLTRIQTASTQASGIFDEASTTKIQELTNKIQSLEEAIEQLRNEAASVAKTGQNVGKTAADIGNGCKKATPQIAAASHQLRELKDAQEKISNIKNAIKNWLGFTEVVNITKNALRDAYNNIKELDATMTEIAVVTDMSQSELWDQVSTYSAIAKQYGATTQGVYEVSQLYYQQGLDTASVMELTTETLKLARIAGVEYADATDYMTVAIRGFKMEMSEAQNVVDVYSNLAAVTASDVEELAVAMSKTASSAEAVGSSFENTSAMIALMVNFLPLIIEKLY